MRHIVVIVLCFFFTMNVLAEQPALHPKLEVFRPYLDTYWQGELNEPDSKDKQIDRSYWSRVLNGMGIKTVHAINDGVYGGESIIFWDETQQSLAYYYFTTAGFYTHGTMRFDESTGSIIAHEKVENNANGITEVQSSSTISGDVLQVQSRYLKNGEWIPRHSVRYQRVAAMPIKFH